MVCPPQRCGRRMGGRPSGLLLVTGSEGPSCITAEHRGRASALPPPHLQLGGHGNHHRQQLRLKGVAVHPDLVRAGGWEGGREGRVGGMRVPRGEEQGVVALRRGAAHPAPAPPHLSGHMCPSRAHTQAGNMCLRAGPPPQRPPPQPALSLLKNLFRVAPALTCSTAGFILYTPSTFSTAMYSPWLSLKMSAGARRARARACVSAWASVGQCVVEAPARPAPRVCPTSSPALCTRTPRSPPPPLHSTPAHSSCGQ